MLIATIAAFLVFACLTLQPFVFYPATLFLMRAAGLRFAEVEPGDPDALSYSICIPAYNEASVIVQKVENSLEAARAVRNCEILIYVDGSSDRTVELLEPYRDRVQVVVGEVRRGKSHGLNILADLAKGDILVFTDANVQLDPAAVRQIGGRFASDARIGCVSGNLVYLNSEENEVASTSSAYWRAEEIIKQLESDVCGVIGADGSLFAVRRSVHVPVPDDLIDDFYLSMRVLLAGHRVVRAPDAIAYERSATNGNDEFRRKIRIACQAFNIHRVIWPEVAKKPLLFYCYVSHRLLKWFVIVDLAATMFFFLLAAAMVFSATTVIVVTVAVIVAIALAWVAEVRLARQLVAVLQAFLGVGIGIFLSLRGERFQTWQPTPSAR